jgi:hypothetical protein
VWVLSSGLAGCETPQGVVKKARDSGLHCNRARELIREMGCVKALCYKPHTLPR